MKKNIIIVLLLFIIAITTSIAAFAHADIDIPKKRSIKEVRQMDKYIDSRLHFTDEQKEHIKKNRPVYRKEMEQIIDKMQKIHDEIHEIYLTGLPGYQTYMLTAPKKAQLILLKQNAANLRQTHRKSFESILTDEQKVEFEKIKAEFAANRKN